MAFQLDRKLTAWQLYHMATDPDFEPILHLIAMHEHAYPELTAWCNKYADTGNMGVLAQPPEPEQKGLFAPKGHEPTNKEIDQYLDERDSALAQANATDHTVDSADDVDATQVIDSTDIADDAIDSEATSIINNSQDDYDAAGVSYLAPSDDAVFYDDAKVVDHRLAKKILLGVVAVACVGGLVFGGVRWHGYAVQKAFADAQNSCAASISTVQTSQKALSTLLKDKTTVAALAYTDQDVRDKHTLTTLKSATKAIKDSAQACSGSTVEDFQQITDANNGLAQRIDGKSVALQKALDAVVKSHKAQADSQKGMLRDAITSAQSTLQDSEGKVADNSTRDALSKAIDTAQAVYKSKSSSVQDIVDVSKAMITASTNVQNSINAKNTADTNAQHQANANKPTDNSSSNSGVTGSSGTNRYTPVPQSSGSNSTPQNNNRSGQTKSTPQSNNGSSAPETWSVPNTDTPTFSNKDGSL